MMGSDGLDADKGSDDVAPAFTEPRLIEDEADVAGMARPADDDEADEVEADEEDGLPADNNYIGKINDYEHKRKQKP